MADWKRFVDPAASAHLQTRLNDARVFVAVDASGSTNWDLGVCINAIESEREFVVAVERTLVESRSDRGRTRSTLHISKWGTYCKSPKSSVNQVHWTGDLEGTYPTSIFQEENSRRRLLASDYWCLFTDGKVDNAEVEALYRVAESHRALVIPVIILITGAQSPGKAELSVGMALYANTADAMFLYKQIGQRRDLSRIYVIRAKGCFAPLGRPNGSGSEYADFENEKGLWDACKRLNVTVTRAEKRSEEAPGIQIGTTADHAGRSLNVTINVPILVNVLKVSSQDLSSLLKPEILNDLAMAARTQGQTDSMRTFLERQRPTSVVADFKDTYRARDIILSEIVPHKDNENIEDARQRLRNTNTWNKQVYQTQLDEVRRTAYEQNQAINTALDRLEAVAQSAYDVNILNAHPSSSQQGRRRYTPETQVIQLDFEAPSFCAQCDICCEDQAMMSLALKHLDRTAIAANTSPSASAHPLHSGKRMADSMLKSHSAFSAQIICYQCAKACMPNSISREKLSAIVPVTQYQGNNKTVINKALYDALTDGTDVGEAQIAQIFIALLRESMEVSVIKKDSMRRSVFDWMLVTMLNNALVPAQFRPGSTQVYFRSALDWILSDCDQNGLKSYAAQYPLGGFKVLLSLGQRAGLFDSSAIARMARTKMLYEMIAAYLRMDSSWEKYWNDMSSEILQSRFWKRLYDVTDVKSLIDSREDSLTTNDFLRFRTFLYILRHFRNGCATVHQIVDHVQNLGDALLGTSISMSASWTGLFDEGGNANIQNLEAPVQSNHQVAATNTSGWGPQAAQQPTVSKTPVSGYRIETQGSNNHTSQPRGQRYSVPYHDQSAYSTQYQASASPSSSSTPAYQAEPRGSSISQPVYGTSSRTTYISPESDSDHSSDTEEDDDDENELKNEKASETVESSPAPVTSRSTTRSEGRHDVASIASYTTPHQLAPTLSNTTVTVTPNPQSTQDAATSYWTLDADEGRYFHWNETSQTREWAP
ncbi:hypothetical protein BDV96DRAFT_644422 [Lophiotrema nucula]|uniref:Uncharacterized protein n=1 Tax=Lophiotrema nucula TaxID=690887 RepID=A0A6A5ZBY5_9PLEO|nr:hypothetical protein BDV96DRAFT_644422 [Lophiotrema nucula]